MGLGFADSGQLADFKPIDKKNKVMCDDNGRNPTVANKMFAQWWGDV